MFFSQPNVLIVILALGLECIENCGLRFVMNSKFEEILKKNEF